jgi:hypothetical protein
MVDSNSLGTPANSTFPQAVYFLMVSGSAFMHCWVAWQAGLLNPKSVETGASSSDATDAQPAAVPLEIGKLASSVTAGLKDSATEMAVPWLPSAFAAGVPAQGVPRVTKFFIFDWAKVALQIALPATTPP